MNFPPVSVPYNVYANPWFDSEDVRLWIAVAAWNAAHGASAPPDVDAIGALCGWQADRVAVWIDQLVEAGALAGVVDPATGRVSELRAVDPGEWEPIPDVFGDDEGGDA